MDTDMPFHSNVAVLPEMCPNQSDVVRPLYPFVESHRPLWQGVDESIPAESPKIITRAGCSPASTYRSNISGFLLLYTESIPWLAF